MQRPPALDLQWLIQQAGWTPLAAYGVQVAVRFCSADPESASGGDWYLSMPLAGGDLLLAVGDVTGHGLAAAAEMVRLRHAMASFAVSCGDPAAILDGLNAMLCRRGQVTATAVAARFRPRSGELTWAQAGHLPILVGSADGVRPLPSPDGIMLGVAAHAQFGQAAVCIEPGDFIVLYTDGIVRRREPLDQGIGRLAALAAAAGCCPAALLEDVDYGAAGDDACVLVAERVR